MAISGPRHPSASSAAPAEHMCLSLESSGKSFTVDSQWPGLGPSVIF